MFLDEKDIIILLLFVVFLIIYNKKQINNFTVDNNILNNIITEDKNKINMVASVVFDITKKNLITNKYTDTFPFLKNELIINRMMADNVTTKNINVTENITINKDYSTLLFDFFPRYAIMPFYCQKSDYSDIPKKWVICNGITWYIHKTDKTLYNMIKPSDQFINDYDVVVVPDLRGRFILGMNDNDMGVVLTDTLAPRPFNSIGGESMVKLNEYELPPHQHRTWFFRNSNIAEPNGTIIKWSSLYNGFGIEDLDDSGDGNNRDDITLGDWNMRGIFDTAAYGDFGVRTAGPDPTTNNIGKQYDMNETAPHNNMPPYHIMVFIMKL
jgi:hypothetical protein